MEPVSTMTETTYQLPPTQTWSTADRGRAPGHRELLSCGVVADREGLLRDGIDEILSTVGVQGSFYNCFGSKEAFGADVIAEYDRYFTRKIDRHLSDAAVPAVERITAFCVDAEEGMQRHSFRRGCVIGNLGQEMNALPEAYRAQIIGVLDGWRERVAACLTTGKANGEIPAWVDCRQSAEAFWIGWGGAVLRQAPSQCRAAADVPAILRHGPGISPK